MSNISYSTVAYGVIFDSARSAVEALKAVTKDSVETSELRGTTFRNEEGVTIHSWCDDSGEECFIVFVSDTFQKWSNLKDAAPKHIMVDFPQLSGGYNFIVKLGSYVSSGHGWVHWSQS